MSTEIRSKLKQITALGLQGAGCRRQGLVAAPGLRQVLWVACDYSLGPFQEGTELSPGPPASGREASPGQEPGALKCAGTPLSAPRC